MVYSRHRDISGVTRSETGRKTGAALTVQGNGSGRREWRRGTSLEGHRARAHNLGQWGSPCGREGQGSDSTASQARPTGSASRMVTHLRRQEAAFVYGCR